jgi:hypothetical protein
MSRRMLERSQSAGLTDV